MIKTSTLAVLVSLIFLLIVNCFGQVTIDPNFKPDLKGGAARLSAIVVQPDGKILVGGDFVLANDVVSSMIARFNPDGTLDQSFQTGKGFDREVKTIALQPDGKILVGGGFSSFNTVPRQSICRLHADGSLDADFTASPEASNNPVIYKILVTPANKLLIGGYFNQFSGTQRNYIVQLNSVGEIDNSFRFGAGPNGSIMDMFLQPDNKIVLTGPFQAYSGTPVPNLCRIHPDGSLDTSFAPDLAFGPTINAIARQSDNKIIVGGFNLKKNGSAVAQELIRLNENGSWDETFTSNNKLAGTVLSLSLRPDDKILAGGVFSQVNGTTTNLPLVLLHADGSVDVNYYSDLKPGANPWTILSLANNEALLIGSLHVNGINDKAFSVVKLDADGKNIAALTNAMELSQPARPHALAVQRDGKIIVSGAFTKMDPKKITYLLRLNKDGSLDSNFRVNLADAYIQDVVYQPDGKIILGGRLFIPGKGYFDLIRLNPDGSLDNTFFLQQSGWGSINCLALQSDGKILVGGQFNQVNGVFRSSIARFNTDGTIDADFKIGSGPTYANNIMTPIVRSLVVQQDQKILVGGGFEKFNNFQSSGLARLHPDGSVDDSFSVGSGSPYSVFAITLHKDGKILVGGSFNSFNGANAGSIVCLNPDGAVDNTFDPYIAGSVNAMQVNAAGKVLAGGLFRWANAAPHNNILQLNSNGSTDISSNISEGINGEVTRIYRYPDDAYLIAGPFSRFNGEMHLSMFRLLPPSPAAPASLEASLSPPNQVDLTWSDQANNELGYEIQRALRADSGFVSVDTTSINATTFTDKNLQGGTTYYYRIRAINSGGNSAWSSEENITTHKLNQTLIFAPIAAKEFGVAPFALRATASSGLPVTFTLISGPATLKDSLLTLTGAGTVRIKASQEGNAHFNAAAEVSQEFTINEAAPTALSVSNITISGLKLEWEGSSPEFRVMRKTTASSVSPTDGELVYEGPNKAFTYTTELTPNTAYFFTVYGKTAGSAAYSLNNKKVAASTAASSTEKVSTVAFLAGETGAKALPNAAASINITQPAANDGYIQVTAAANPVATAGLPSGIKSLVAEKYWIVTGIGLEANAVTYTLTVDVADMTSVSDFNKITILYRNNAHEAWSDLLASNSTVQETLQDNKLSLTNLSFFPQISIGVNTVTGMEDPVNLDFSLKQNFPNPFDKTTTVQYDLKKQARVVLEVIDAQGRIVQQLVKQNQKRGSYQVVVDGAGLKSRSLYFIRLQANGQKAAITAIYQ
jgi:uncharacterized delta-60 repeat protein